MVKELITYLNFVRFIFHIIAYLHSSNKKDISSDIRVGIKHRKLNYRTVFGLVYLLSFDKFFRNLFYHRLGQWSIIIQWIGRPHPSFIIATKAKIGGGMLCVHPFSTILNAREIGTNFTVKNDVTIGHNILPIGPMIGDNVTINVHSVVVGDISIGDNVTIGAGSVVFKSVPDNSVIVGNPARIIKINNVKCNKNL